MTAKSRNVPGRMIRCLFAVALVAAAFAVMPSLASAATLGTLSQLAAPNGCINSTADGSDPFNTSAGTPCSSGQTASGSTVQPMEGPSDVAITPDGKFEYVASYKNDTVTLYDRNPTTGALTQVSGPAGCVQWQGDTVSSNCTGVPELRSPEAIAISGNFLYVASHYGASTGQGGVAVFSRGADGALTEVSCLAEGDGTSNDADNCPTASGLNGLYGIAASPDGSHVYTAGGNLGPSGNIAVLTANGSGGLSEASGNCVAEDYGPNESSCGSGNGIEGANSVAVAPDGKSVYVGSFTFDTLISGFFRNDPDGSLSSFSVGADGALTQLPGSTGCISSEDDLSIYSLDGCSIGHGLMGLDSVKVSPDSKSVYTGAFGSSYDFAGLVISGGLGEFSRDTVDASLGQLTQVGCLNNEGADTCGVARGLDNTGAVAVSKDGKNVYATSASYYVSGNCLIVCVGQSPKSSNALISNYINDAVVSTARAADGTLSQLPGTDGCVEEANDNSDGCSNGLSLLGAFPLTVSPDDEHVYVAGDVSTGLTLGLSKRQGEGSTDISSLLSFNRTDQPPVCNNITLTAGRSPASTPVQLSCADPDSNPIVDSIVTNPSHGTIGPVSSTGQVTYTPAAGFTGTDTFTYRTTDQIGQNGDEQSNVATVTLVVPAVGPSKIGKPSLHVAGIHGGCTRATFPVVLSSNSQGGKPKITVFLDGHKLKTKTVNKLRLLIHSNTLHSGRHHLRIVVKGKGGTTSRTVGFTVCGARVGARFTG